MEGNNGDYLTQKHENLFEKSLHVESKDIYVDLKQNANGIYLKISEKNERGRNSVINNYICPYYIYLN